MTGDFTDAENVRDSSMFKKKDSGRKKKKKTLSCFRFRRKRKFRQKRISSQSSPKSGGILYKIISKYIFSRRKTSGKVLETQNDEFEKANELKLSSELYDLSTNQDHLPGTSKSFKQNKQTTSDQKSKQATKLKVSDTSDLDKIPETDISDVRKILT